MTRREQLVDDAAEVAALLEQPDDAEDAQLVDELGDVPDDDSPIPTREQVRVAALLCAHATSGTDLDDLAGVLGVRHAVEPAERWLNALSRAAAEPPRPPMAQALLEHLVPDAEAADETYPADVTPVMAAILAGAPPFLAVEAAASVALDRDPEYGTHVVPEHWGDEPTPSRGLPTGPQPCEVCGLNVTAQKIAETGRARHPWHPED